MGYSTCHWCQVRKINH
nr:thioredoxin domain-containing protein [Sporobacter termitidis]